MTSNAQLLYPAARDPTAASTTFLTHWAMHLQNCPKTKLKTNSGDGVRLVGLQDHVEQPPAENSTPQLARTMGHDNYKSAKKNNCRTRNRNKGNKQQCG